MDDLGLTFQDIRVSIEELQDYAKHVDPVTFIAKPPNYPVPRANMLNFPPPNSKEVLQREENMEHVHDYLPVMYPELAGRLLCNVSLAVLCVCFLFVLFAVSLQHLWSYRESSCLYLGPVSQRFVRTTNLFDLWFNTGSTNS